MIVTRIVKWATAGVLALGSIPAVGFAHSHVSLPTSAVTVTPTGMEAPAAAKTRSQITHAKTAKVQKASIRKHTAAQHKKTGASHRKPTTAQHAKKAAHHAKPSSQHKKLTSSRTHKAAAHKAKVSG